MSSQPDPAMTIADPGGLSATDIAAAVQGRKLSALAVTEAALARIARFDPVLNAFTDVTADRARARARAMISRHPVGQAQGRILHDVRASRREC